MGPNSESWIDIPKTEEAVIAMRKAASEEVFSATTLAYGTALLVTSLAAVAVSLVGKTSSQAGQTGCAGVVDIAPLGVPVQPPIWMLLPTFAAIIVFFALRFVLLAYVNREKWNASVKQAARPLDMSARKLLEVMVEKRKEEMRFIADMHELSKPANTLGDVMGRMREMEKLKTEAERVRGEVSMAVEMHGSVTRPGIDATRKQRLQSVGLVGVPCCFGFLALTTVATKIYQVCA